MQQFRVHFLTTMTFVAVVSSVKEVLDNTAEKKDWIWIIKDPQLPRGISGVSLNAKLYYDEDIIQSLYLFSLPKLESHLAHHYRSAYSSTFR